MVIKTTQHEVAEWILDILVRDLALKPGDPLPDHRLKEEYRARNGDGADIKAGLKYAQTHDWMTYDQAKDTWYLTELGYQVA